MGAREVQAGLEVAGAVALVGCHPSKVVCILQYLQYCDSGVLMLGWQFLICTNFWLSRLKEHLSYSCQLVPKILLLSFCLCDWGQLPLRGPTQILCIPVQTFHKEYGYPSTLTLIWHVCVPVHYKTFIMTSGPIK